MKQLNKMNQKVWSLWPYLCHMSLSTIELSKQHGKEV